MHKPQPSLLTAGASMLTAVVVSAGWVFPAHGQTLSFPGGDISISTFPGAEPAKREGWMHQAQTKVLFFPDFLTAKRPDGSKYLVSYVKQGTQSAAGEGDDARNVSDWYRLFAKNLTANFTPAAAGGLLATVTVKSGGIDSVSFFGLQPGSYEPGFPADKVDKTAIEQSVLSALKKTMADPQLALPANTASVEIRLGLAGNPDGGSFQLVLDPLDLPLVKEGKQTPDFMCKITPRTAESHPKMEVKSKMGLKLGGITVGGK